MLLLKVLAKCCAGESLKTSSVTQMAVARPADEVEVEKLMSSVELQNQSFASSPLEAK